MEEIKWGIIGCGDVVERKSGPAFQKVPNSKLVAVMRRNAEKAMDFASRHHVPKWTGDADVLIGDPEVNAIYVATPPAAHEAYAIAALAAGKHVYLEKPMALDSKGALRISEAAAKSKGKLVVAHYRRELPAFKKVKQLLENHSIGQPLFVNLSMLQPPQSSLIATSETNWRTDPSISGGGLFHDLAPHQLDLMIYFFGSAKGANGFSANQLKHHQADDLVSGMIRFDNELVFRGLWCFSVPEVESTDSIEIFGSEGKIAFSMFGEKVTVVKEGKAETFNFKNPTYVQQPMIEETVRYFIGEGKNPCPANDAVEVMEIMDAFTAK